MSFFSSDPTPLEHIKETLHEDLNLDFVSTLERHHDFLEESIDVILDRTATVQNKKFNLSRFIRLLNMHAKAEEQTLYAALKMNHDRNARVEGTFAQDEHDIAEQLVEELEEMNFETSWTEEIDAKAQVLVSLVQSHIREEEKEIFKTAESIIPERAFSHLHQEYLAKCEQLLEGSSQTAFTGSKLDVNRPSAAI